MFAQSIRPASLAGVPLEKWFHTCAFIRGRDEEYRVLSPFLREGLEWGEKLVYIVDPKISADHPQRLEQAGVPVCSHPHQFDQLTWDQTYLRDGRFDQEFMLEAVTQTIKAGVEAGFPRLRIVGQMGWALQEHPGIDKLIEYEVRVNDVLARTRHPAVCVYDLNHMSAAMMMDLMRAHPMTIVGGTLYENPFFTPAEEMLRELRGRAA